MLLDLVVSLQLSVQQHFIRMFPWLLLAFPFMHIAWASGFFVRIFEGSHPAKHWRK